MSGAAAGGPGGGPLLDCPLMCFPGLLFCPFLNGKCEARPPEGMRGGGERTLLTSPADRKPAPGESRGSRFPLPAPSSSCRVVGVGVAGPGPVVSWGLSGPLLCASEMRPLLQASGTHRAPRFPPSSAGCQHFLSAARTVWRSLPSGAHCQALRGLWFFQALNWFPHSRADKPCSCL